LPHSQSDILMYSICIESIKGNAYKMGEHENEQANAGKIIILKKK
jgi:hypothetical protein